MNNETTVLMFIFAGAAVAMLVAAVRLGEARRRRAHATLRRIEAETAQERERQEEKRRVRKWDRPRYEASLSDWERQAAAARMQGYVTEEELERRAVGQRNTRSDDSSIYADVTYLMAVNAAVPPVEREVSKSPALSMGYGSDFSTGGGFGSDTSFSTGSDSSCSSDSGSSSCSSD